MRAVKSDPMMQGGWGRSANDEFKARSERRLCWSLAAAAGLHGMLLVFSPDWQREALPELSFVDFGVELLALQGTGGASFGNGTVSGTSSGPIVVAEATSADEDEAGQGEGQDLPDWSIQRAYDARGTDALRAELDRRSAPVPILAEPELEAASPSESSGSNAASDGGTQGGGSTIGAAAALSDFEALTDDELLALERLSALRPELGFTSPSSWVLIRNPSELTDFLSERFTGPERGAVSVAIWVDERGSVEWAEIQRSSGREDLDASALELFRDVVTFRPARQGGVNVPTALIFSVPFPW